MAAVTRLSAEEEWRKILDRWTESDFTFMLRFKYPVRTDRVENINTQTFMRNALRRVTEILIARWHDCTSLYPNKLN